MVVRLVHLVVPRSCLVKISLGWRQGTGVNSVDSFPLDLLRSVFDVDRGNQIGEQYSEMGRKSAV